MQELQVFKNSEFGEVGVVTVDGKEYFPATACAKILGYTNPHKAIKDHCRYLTKREVPHPQSLGKTIEVNFIPEGDLFRLITHSKLPTAERFERWVFDEVLSTIRKQGYYSAHDAFPMDKVMEIVQLTATTMMAEFVKQVVPVIVSAVQQRPTTTATVKESPVKWPFCEPYRPTRNSSIIGRLVPELRQSVENMISSPYYTQDDIVDFLSEHGVQLSRMAVSRYARQMTMTGRF